MEIPITTDTDISKIYSVSIQKKDEAEVAKDLTIKELYEKEIARGWMSIVDDISDIEVEVVEIESDKLVDIELGGYCE